MVAEMAIGPRTRDAVKSLSTRLATPQAALVGLIVLGAVLRLLRLDQLGDFDFDEVAAIWYARNEPGDILATIARAPFEHPPLYYIALHYWSSWFGEAEPIARAFSVPMGLLLIPVTYRLARQYLMPWPAVFAAAVVAASPLLIFYSREARMYAAAALFGTLALLLFETAMRRGDRRSWLWLGVTVVVGAYIDFTAVLGVVAMNLALPFHWRRRRRVMGFVALEFVGLAAVLPWLLFARGLSDSLPAFGTGDLGAPALREVASSAWLDLFVGAADVRGGRSAPLVAAILGILSLAGVAVVFARRRGGLLLAYVVAALGFLLVLLAFDKPYQARYVLPVIPIAAVLAAFAVGALPRRRWAATGVVALTLVGLAGPVYASRSYYGEYRRGDYRSITTTIEELARPRRVGRDEGKFRDAVVLAGPWQGWYWRHYFPSYLDKVDVWFLPDEVPPAVTDTEVTRKLQRAADNHRRLWVVLAGLEQADPNNFTESWLSTHLWQARSEVYRNGVLQLYLTNVLDLVDRKGRVEIAEDFETSLIQFSGFRPDQGPREAGDGVRFSVFLQAKRALDYDLKLRVWLRGSDGVVYAKDLFAHDDFLHRTSEWTPGETHVVRTAIWLPAEATPGQYEAYVSFIGPDGTALPARGRLAGFEYPLVNYLWLGPVRIEPPAVPLANEAALRELVGGPIR